LGDGVHQNRLGRLRCRQLADFGDGHVEDEIGRDDARRKIAARFVALLLDDASKAVEAGKTYKVAGWASVNPQQDKPVWDVFAAYLRREKAAKPKKLNRVALKGVSNNPGISG
jgi:hypothetical protein